MLVTLLDVSDIISILVASFDCCRQYILSPTSVTNIDVAVINDYDSDVGDFKLVTIYGCWWLDMIAEMIELSR